ncbi:YceI family protein [Chitinophaga sp.]|uniref:YceI family protein n=1 Tax=Chitinophaga sp. TaxID=1869181 RepID=UPI0031DA802E
MKKLLLPVTALIIIVTSAFTVLSGPDYKIAAGYAVKFSASGANGIFKDLKGKVVFDEQHLNTSKFDVTIDVSSINTGNGLKNNHAKGEKWFDAKKYPTIAFTSTEITKSGSGYVAKGELTMHGVKRPLSIPFTFVKTAGGGTFEGKFDVNRSDFGVGEKGGKVDDIIKLDVSVPVN